MVPLATLSANRIVPAPVSVTVAAGTPFALSATTTIVVPTNSPEAARIGAVTPTRDSTLAQTFTAPSGRNQLSLWYLTQCPDTITFDWFTITLRDNTTGTTTTLLPRTCTILNSYVKLTAGLTAGHSYTLTLTNHDDNATGDATRTFIDDVVVATVRA